MPTATIPSTSAAQQGFGTAITTNLAACPNPNTIGRLPGGKPSTKVHLFMVGAIESGAEAAGREDTCDRCLRLLSPGWAFGFKVKLDPTEEGGQGLRAELNKCLLCSLRHWPMLKKSLAACVVVGTILTALNQGDILLAGQWNSTLWWKIPLTYTVPFMVATYGALINNRK